MVFTHREDIAPTVRPADRADVMGGPGAAALRTDDEVRDRYREMRPAPALA